MDVVKLSAKGKYDLATLQLEEYISAIDCEIANANEAVEISRNFFEVREETSSLMLKKQVSQQLGITMDTLRNWERNGLLVGKKKENGYRVYDQDDLNRLRVIRSLRCANYSLSAILRMMNSVERSPSVDIGIILDNPEMEEDIVSVCDKLIQSLQAARQNATNMMFMLVEMKSRNET